MKPLFIIVSFVAVSLMSYTQATAQCNDRYLSEIFTTLSIDSNIQFGESVNDTGATIQLLMDVYEPGGDTETDRPLLIFCHQGGFYSGTKSDSDIVKFCTDFAKMGYVTASIEYRLTDLANLLDSVNMIKAVFRGLQDGKAAIRYFRMDAAGANTYNIDPNGIFFGGSSAGAILSTHLVYMDDSTAMPLNWQVYMDSVGGMEGQSGNPGYSTEVLAVYNFAGTLADTNWLEAGKPPLFSSHTVDDPLADYDYGPPYGSTSLPSMYGSSLLHQRAMNIGMESTFYSYPGNLHPPYKDPPIFDSSIVHLRDFLYQYVPCNTVSVGGELDEKNLFNVYPNPANTNVYIATNGTGNESTLVTVYDNTGHLIDQVTSSNATIELDIRSYCSGLYLLVIDQEGFREIERVVVR